MARVYLTRGFTASGMPLHRIGDAPPPGVGPNGITPTESLRLLDRKPEAKDDGATGRILPDIVQRSARPLHPTRDGLTFGEYMPWRR
jgi:hypothetical protein